MVTCSLQPLNQSPQAKGNESFGLQAEGYGGFGGHVWWPFRAEGYHTFCPKNTPKASYTRLHSKTHFVEREMQYFKEELSSNIFAICVVRHPPPTHPHIRVLGKVGLDKRVLSKMVLSQRVLGKVGLIQRVLGNVGLIKESWTKHV